MARGLLTVEIEEPLGPGVDVEFDLTAGRALARRARLRGPWLGLDRGSVVDTDDGRGRRLPVLVGLPASTFAGCRVETQLCGALANDASPPIILAVVPGGELPARPIVLAVARRATARWLDAADADSLVRDARRLFRERRARERIVDGRAWSADTSPLAAVDRFSTPHSLAEYSLRRLPPRFHRGLEGLLDTDERVIYWVERPQLRDVGIVERVRGRLDRRAALLLLTDRQLLWMVDHAQPDVYLSDWGVDVEAIPVENVAAADVTESDTDATLEVRTGRGRSAYALPLELASELRVAAALLRRFLPGADDTPRRIYTIERLEFDRDEAGRFGQAADADRLRALIDEPLAFLFSPRRAGQRTPAALAITRDSAQLLGARRRATLALGRIHAVRLVLSPLIGRLNFVADGSSLELVFPATFSSTAAALVRLARRLIANP
jgi:hypothetical protein